MNQWMEKIMKNNKQRGILLGIALLGATTLVGFTAPASAKPDRKNDGIPNNAPVTKRNDGIPNNARRNPNNDGIPNNAPVTRRNDGIPNNAGRNPFNDGVPNNAPITPRNDGIPNNARPNIGGRNPYNDGIPNNARNGNYQNRPGYNGNRTGQYNNGRYNNGQYNNGVYNNGVYNNGRYGVGNSTIRSIRGTVSNLRSQQSFDLRSGNTTYQVRATSRTPRALSNGDYVEVIGDLRSGNELRNASVSLLRNR
jgi:hypothetical protein